MRLDDVSVVFGAGEPTETVAVRKLSLDVYPGDFVTVIGSNGAGKSTVLNLISGGVFPTSGAVLLRGESVSKTPDFRRARWLSHVFQNPLAGTAPGLTIEENMSLALRRGSSRGLKVACTRARRDQYVEALAELGIGLESRLKEQAGLLSGGQRQALALIMATLERPSVLLLDEHTAALDPPNHAMIMALTHKLVRTHELTAVMVTHNMRAAVEYGNRLLMLHQGNVVMSASGEQKKALTPESLLAEFAQLRGAGVEDRIAMSVVEDS